MITSLLAFTIRMALVAGMTFLFVVLFEHGPANYVENVQADFSKLVQAVNPSALQPRKNLPTAGLDEPASGR